MKEAAADSSRYTFRNSKHDYYPVYLAAGKHSGVRRTASISLDDKIGSYPELNAAVYSGAWEAVIYDGKICGVLVLNDGNLYIDNVYVHKDWLDKLNLGVPATLEEYEAVARVFRNQDPDSNNKNNIFGYIGMIVCSAGPIYLEYMVLFQDTGWRRTVHSYQQTFSLNWGSPRLYQ